MLNRLSISGGLFSLLQSLLFGKALLYLIEKRGCIFSSAASLFLFLTDLFLDSLASSSLSIFLFFSESGLLFGLLTSLGRSHRTLLGILFQLLSVVVGVIEGRKSFLVQAICLLLASFARITVSVITLTFFGISACESDVIFPYVTRRIRHVSIHCLSVVFQRLSSWIFSFFCHVNFPLLYLYIFIKNKLGLRSHQRRAYCGGEAGSLGYYEVHSVTQGIEFFVF